MTNDYEYSFKAPNGVPSMCRIRTYDVKEGFHKGDTVVICSQLADDEKAGMSVTNAAETIATGVMLKHQLSPMRMIWIEHYPARGFGFEETIDRVTFDVRLHATRQTGNALEGHIRLAHAQWVHKIAPEFIEQLTGEQPFPQTTKTKAKKPKTKE